MICESPRRVRCAGMACGTGPSLVNDHSVASQAQSRVSFGPQAYSEPTESAKITTAQLSAAQMLHAAAAPCVNTRSTACRCPPAHQLVIGYFVFLVDALFGSEADDDLLSFVRFVRHRLYDRG